MDVQLMINSIYIWFFIVIALNQVTLLGRVGGEPQKRGTEQHPVVVFSLATHTNFKDESGIVIIT